MIAEIILSDTLFGAVTAFATAVILSLVGWTLTQAVSLGRIVSRLEERSDDHDRRLADLERG